MNDQNPFSSPTSSLLEDENEIIEQETKSVLWIDLCLGFTLFSITSFICSLSTIIFFEDALEYYWLYRACTITGIFIGCLITLSAFKIRQLKEFGLAPLNSIAFTFPLFFVISLGLAHEPKERVLQVVFPTEYDELRPGILALIPFSVLGALFGLAGIFQKPIKRFHLGLVVGCLSGLSCFLYLVGFLIFFIPSFF